MPLRGLISATFQRGDCVVVMNEITSGTADAARGKIFITRGTVDSTRGSGDAMNGNVYTTRRTVHSTCGFGDATRGIVDSMRGSTGVTRGKNDNAGGPAAASDRPDVFRSCRISLPSGLRLDEKRR